ncbi:hypothetical protein, partial [Amycolatopsis japonica]
MWEDGRIEEIQATPEELTAKPDGGVSEHDGVRYVDLATPGWQEWPDLSWDGQIPAAQRQDQLPRAAKRKATGPPPASEGPRRGTVSNLGEAQGATWLPNSAKTARHDAKVVDRWHAEPPASGDPALSKADKEAMGEFAGRLLQRKPVEGGVPWDIQLHVTVKQEKPRDYCESWFELLEEELKTALIARGVPEGSELLRFDFDHIEHQAKKNLNILPGVDIFIHDTARQTIREYQKAQNLELLFLPLRKELVAASRRKLRWRVEELARVESDQRLLVLELRTAENLRAGRVASVVEEVKAAARKAYRENSESKAEAFLEKRTTIIYGSAKNGQGLSVDLIPLSTDAPVSLRDASKVVEEQSAGGHVSRGVRKEWHSWVEKARKKARRAHKRSAGAEDLFELTRTKRPRLRRGANVAPGGRDAEVVGRWHVKRPTSGFPVLSKADGDRLGALADHLLLRKPVEGGVPWDVQLHVTEFPKRLKEYGQKWFELLEEELKAALMSRGVPEDAELLRFDFDHIEHHARKEKNILPSVDILVHDTTGQMIQEYQNSRHLDLYFVPYREEFTAASRRKLCWRVAALARDVDGLEGARSLLVLHLRSAKNSLEGHVKSVTRAVNAAVRTEYREKSDVEIENFIKKRIELICGTSTQSSVLFADVLDDELFDAAEPNTPVGPSEVGGAAGRLLQRKPAEGEVPWDIHTPSPVHKERQSRAHETPGVLQEEEPGGGWMPDVPGPPDPLSWLEQPALSPEGIEPFDSLQERGEWPNDWAYGSYSGDMYLAPDEARYFDALGFASPRLGVSLLSEVVVGGVDVGDVECVVLRRGSGVVGALF